MRSGEAIEEEQQEEVGGVAQLPQAGGRARRRKGQGEGGGRWEAAEEAVDGVRGNGVGGVEIGESPN